MENGFEKPEKKKFLSICGTCGIEYEEKEKEDSSQIDGLCNTCNALVNIGSIEIEDVSVMCRSLPHS